MLEQLQNARNYRSQNLEASFKFVFFLTCAKECKVVHSEPIEQSSYFIICNILEVYDRFIQRTKPGIAQWQDVALGRFHSLTWIHSTGPSSPRLNMLINFLSKSSSFHFYDPLLIDLSDLSCSQKRVTSAPLNVLKEACLINYDNDDTDSICTNSGW